MRWRWSTSYSGTYLSAVLLVSSYFSSFLLSSCDVYCNHGVSMPNPVLSTCTTVLPTSTTVISMSSVVYIVLAEKSFSIAPSIAVYSAPTIPGILSTSSLSSSLVCNFLEDCWYSWHHLHELNWRRRHLHMLCRILCYWKCLHMLRLYYYNYYSCYLILR